MAEEVEFRVGLIGCGDAGAAHALTVHRHPATTLAACLDAQPERAAEIASRHGAIVAADPRSLLASRPDLVVIATGPLAQPAVVAQLLDLGYRGGLLCEKPLASSLASAAELVERAERAGVVLAVNHQRRFSLAVRRAAEMLERGDIGTLLRIEGHAEQGTLFDWAPHWVDVALLLTGDSPVSWVQGLLDRTEGRTHAGIVLEGRSIAVWQHENAVRGVLECGAAVAGQPLLRLLGSEGMIEVGAVEQRDGVFTRGPALRMLGAGGGWRALDVGESALAAAQWSRALDELLAAMRERRAPAHSGVRAMAALEVCLAAYLAATTGVPQRLPISPAVDVRDVLAGARW